MGLKNLPPDVAARLTGPGVTVNPEAFGVDVPEKEFQAAVRAFAESAGWLVYSVPDSRRATAAGYPDLTLCKPSHPRHPVIVAELKRAGQKPRASQRDWLWCFAAAGVPAFCWTPESWPEIRRVLG